MSQKEKIRCNQTLYIYNENNIVPRYHSLSLNLYLKKQYTYSTTVRLGVRVPVQDPRGYGPLDRRNHREAPARYKFQSI